MKNSLNGTYIENAALIFGTDQIFGGRQNKEAGGIVKVCFELDEDAGDIFFTLYDNLSAEDGHYSPVTLEVGQAETLRDWLTFQLDKLAAPKAD